MITSYSNTIAVTTLSIEPEYQAILNYAISVGYNLPSSTQQQAGNILVSQLKQLGIWSLIDRLYIYTNDAASGFEWARINWKNPVSSERSNLISSPNFDPSYGFGSNGTSSYINTTFNPATSGVNWTSTSNSVCIGVYQGLTSTNTAFGSRIASTDKSQTAGLPFSQVLRHYGDNVDFPSFSAGTLQNNAIIQSNLNGNQVTQFQNGTLLRTVNLSVVGASPNFPFYVGAINNNGGTQFNGTGYTRFVMFGGNISASNFSTAMFNFYNNIGLTW